MSHGFTVYIGGRGFLTWDDEKGCVTHTPRIEDAATFDAADAHAVATRYGGAVVTVNGELLTMAQREAGAHV